MGEQCYAPLIEDMVFSYSRLRAFHDCPYRWYLQYIAREPSEDTFFATYGSFIHRLLAEGLSGTTPYEQLPAKYLSGFLDSVRGTPPSAKVFHSFFQDGLEALKRFRGFGFEPVAIESRCSFLVRSWPFQGILDCVLRRPDGGLILLDHKSRALKPRSKRDKPTKTDLELDAYLRQLYLYSIPVFETFGAFPDQLGFHCYRTGELILEPFRDEAFREAQDWAENTIQSMLKTSRFPPDMEYFKCGYLCSLQSACEYYEQNEGR